MRLANLISIEKGTLRWRIARDILTSLGDDSNSLTGDYELFSDSGILEVLTLYDDTIEANKAKIEKEERKHLMYTY